MVTILISIIAGAALGIRMVRYEDFGDKLFLGMVLGVGVGTVGAGVAALLPQNYAPRCKDYALVSLNDGKGVEGRIHFLGSGYIKDKMVFTYYVANGEYHTLEQAPAGNSRVKYSEKGNIVSVTEYFPTDVWYNWFSLPAYEPDTEYVFHVPEGSIVQQFNLDAQ